MQKIKKILSIFLVALTIICCSNFTAFADSSITSCITYNSTLGHKDHGKSSYINKNYTIRNGKTVKIQAYWSSDDHYAKLKNQRIGGKYIKDLLRFDVHIIDKKTNKVVNYWYSLKSGDKFTVKSNVKGITSKDYTVKVTSYLYNYKTYTNSNLSGVATLLKYKLVY